MVRSVGEELGEHLERVGAVAAAAELGGGGAEFGVFLGVVRDAVWWWGVSEIV